MAKPTMLYPAEEQRDRWDDKADEMGYKSLSKWSCAMIEAGMKNFTIDPTNEEIQKLRRQRNQLQERLDVANERINELEAFKDGLIGADDIED